MLDTQRHVGQRPPFCGRHRGLRGILAKRTERQLGARGVTIRLVLADDHVLVRQGLRKLLEAAGFVVAGEAGDGLEAVHLVRRENPDVAIIDIGMPQFNGLSAALELTHTQPHVRLIMLTQHDQPQYVAEALRCGVKGYVLKNQAARDLVRAIEGVCRGEVYLSPGVSSAIAEAYASQDPTVDGLSVRERQVLQLIAEGSSTKDIAARLGISAKTVESHRSKLMRKLDIHDTAGLVRYAIRRGVTQA
ncbi:MAG: response regulator transcription factor [Gammaproteobacteria bacterium]|nr:response regulator transcription factor [Gammaproteobacteria bacterium]